MVIIGVESDNSNARLPVGLDEFEPVLIFFLVKEKIDISSQIFFIVRAMGISTSMFHALPFNWRVINLEKIT